MVKKIDEDTKYMQLALNLAKKGRTSPNPLVGAVVVLNGEIIGKGCHKKAGAPHAEVNALRGITAEGATLYVNLEPCSHYGKTPPCTELIIKSGIKRVVCAMEDPNPLVHGIEELQNHGINVKTGVLEEKARKLNEKFIKYTKTELPFVTVKCAVSLDGKICCNTGDSKWITSDRARKYARELRGEYDAILVGINTVLQDDPGLRAEKGDDPLRIILDSTLKIPVNATVLSDPHVIVVTTERYNREKREQIEKKGKIWICGTEKVDLRQLMQNLGEKGITSVLIEGGSEVSASAVRERIVDKFYFFIAPKLITGRNVKGPLGGEGIDMMSAAIRLKDLTVRRIGEDILIEAYPDW
jgi:diaminohydroxyphosphoribosylaminopyrimidine deaminase/5-amino-6-(5-phosphoribosylamino)uracil reductase